jgi:hypothetical protein
MNSKQNAFSFIEIIISMCLVTIFSFNLFINIKFLNLKKESAIKNFYADITMDNILNILESNLDLNNMVNDYDHALYKDIFDFKIKKYFFRFDTEDKYIKLNLDKKNSVNIDDNDKIDVEIIISDEKIIEQNFKDKNLILCEIFLIDLKNNKNIRHEIFVI